MSPLSSKIIPKPENFTVFACVRNKRSCLFCDLGYLYQSHENAFDITASKLLLNVSVLTQ